VDGLTLDDLRDARFPNLRAFAARGYVGLMSTPVKGPANPSSALLTLASGTLCQAEPTDDEAFRADEPVEGDRALTVWMRRTGFDPAAATNLGSETVVHLGIAPLIRREMVGLLPAG